MNPIALSIADGTAFFFGLMLIFLSELFHFVRASKNSSELNDSGRKTASRLNNAVLFLLIVLGCILVLISSTPLPKAMSLFFFLLVVSNLFLRFRFAQKTRKKVSGTILFATLILVAVELPYHLPVRFSAPEAYEIYVIGDSLSAGNGSKGLPWPEQLEKLSRKTVINLAQPGATVQDAIQFSSKVPEKKSLVIIEIGGNDLFNETEAAVFRKRLEKLVSYLKEQDHTLLMFELPLLPFQNEYGRAQREIASKYQVTLIPKWVLTTVLGMKKGTIDGLHLSEAGHQRLAQRLWKILKN